MQIWHAGMLAIGMLAASEACDGQVLKGTPARAAGAIDGYGGIAFGTSAAELIRRYGAEAFNSAAVARCADDLALTGCLLIEASDRPPFSTRDAIGYSLQLSFNRHDRLTDISLVYAREGAITRGQCLDIHTRTLDWVVQDYGPLRSTQVNRRGLPQRTTAGGNPYFIGGLGKDFVSIPLRTASPSMPEARQALPIPKWDDARYVSVLSFFILVDGKPNCRVEVDFSEPPSIERRP